MRRRRGRRRRRRRRRREEGKKTPVKNVYCLLISLFVSLSTYTYMYMSVYNTCTHVQVLFV